MTRFFDFSEMTPEKVRWCRMWFQVYMDAYNCVPGEVLDNDIVNYFTRNHELEVIGQSEFCPFYKWQVKND